MYFVLLHIEFKFVLNLSHNFWRDKLFLGDLLQFLIFKSVSDLVNRNFLLFNAYWGVVFLDHVGAAELVVLLFVL
jgi:hypothetical protein